MKGKQFILNANDIKQYVYCPRIPFYNNLLPGAGRRTYAMQAGINFENSLTDKTIKELFAAEIEEGYSLKKELRLTGKNIHLRGALDYALIHGKVAFPIEVKHSEHPSIYKVQLAAYAMLLEDALNVQVKYGYFVYAYTNTNPKIDKVKITKDDKITVINIMTRLRSYIITRVRPDPTLLKAKCNFCEFRNFCDDVF